MTTQPSDWDVIALEVALRFTQDTEPQLRANLQLAVIDAIKRARELDASGTTNSVQISSSLVVGEARDAARYRWLKAQNAITETPDAWTITRCDFTDEEEPIRYWVGDDLDAAIDSAMQQGGGGGEAAS